MPGQIAIRCSALLAVFCGWTSAALAQEKYFVQIEIVSSPRLGIDVNQQWLEVLSDVGADDVRVRQSQRTNDRPGVEKIESTRGSTYKVTGVLDSRGQLALPGGTFSLREKSAIRELIGKIRDDGAEVALAEKMAFGLTAEQLVALHQDLSETVRESTRDVSPRQVLADVKRTIKTPIVIDPGVMSLLKKDYALQDELRGLSQGTALAAALRPLGLVMAPRRLQGQQAEIVITDARHAEEHWPIGWPLEMRPSQAAPQLFERVPANIRNYALGKALASIQSSLGLPFLYDYNSMARQGVDLNEIRVNLQSDKISYQIVLQRLISQARPRMDMEVRADENGKPFIWFSAR